MNQLTVDTQIAIPQILPGLTGGEVSKTPVPVTDVFTSTLSGAIADVDVETKGGRQGGSARKSDDDLVDLEALPVNPAEEDAPIAETLTLPLDLGVTPKKYDDDLVDRLTLANKVVLSSAPVSPQVINDPKVDDDLPESATPIRIKHSESDALPLEPKGGKTGGMTVVKRSRPQPHAQPPTITIETEPIPGDAKATVPGDAKITVSDDPKTKVIDDAKMPVFSDAKNTVSGEAKTKAFGDAKLTVSTDAKMTVSSDAKSTVSSEAKPPVYGDLTNSDKTVPPTILKDERPVVATKASPVVRSKVQVETDTLEHLESKGQTAKPQPNTPAANARKSGAASTLVLDQTAKPIASDTVKPVVPVGSEVLVPDAKNTSTLSQKITTDKPVAHDGAAHRTKRALTPPATTASKPVGPTAGQVELKAAADITIEVSNGTVTKTSGAGETLAADAAPKIQKSKPRTVGTPNVERNAPQPLASEATVEEPVRPQGSNTTNAGTPEPVVASQARMTVKNAGTSTDKLAGTEIASARPVFTTPDAAATAARVVEMTAPVANRPAETAATEPTPRFIIDLPKPLRIPSQIRIRLDPPELGAVRIDLHAGRNGIVGTLRFQSDNTRGVVERDLGQLHRALHEAGVRVERLEVAGGRSAEFRESLNSQTSNHQQWSQQSSRGQYQQTGTQPNPWRTDSERSYAQSQAWDAAPEIMGIINRDGQRGVNLVA